MSPAASFDRPVRHLVLVLGDQLWFDNPALAGFDPAQDLVLMIEAPGEASLVWSHKARLVVFLSAMRHFAQRVQARGWPLQYLRLDEPAWDDAPDLTQRLARCLATHRPQSLWVCEPGEWRLQQSLAATAADAGVPLRSFEDTHFLCSRARFARWAKGRREWRMEYFYREMRREHGVLMDGGGPLGGQWNFDADNRSAYPLSLIHI